VTALALLTALLTVAGQPTVMALSGVPPMPGPVVRRFDPPAQTWLAGHRGVDFLGAVGDQVTTVAAGEVTFAGKVAGKGVVTVTHGELRTTYEPVTAEVSVGAHVAAGQLIATLDGGHDCPATTCLHLGLKRGDEYLDPMSLFGLSRVRLLPESAVALVRQLAADRARSLASSASMPGTLSMPTDGTLGSPFGMRMHPIFHEERMHEGQDISAPCGTPIRAAAAGRVQSVTYDDSGGHRLIIDHGQIGGRQLRTHYLHAEGYQVRPGDQVARGETVGTVGTTGWSTGCHLHFSVSLSGDFVDPMGFL
jgi:murein DD-endopeptidase MepM/ murein hydrolase activator NlpD